MCEQIYKAHCLKLLCGSDQILFAVAYFKNAINFITTNLVIFCIQLALRFHNRVIMMNKSQWFYYSMRSTSFLRVWVRTQKNEDTAYYSSTIEIEYQVVW